jgi:hypothetical protein
MNKNNHWFTGCYQIEWIDKKKLIFKNNYIQSLSHDSLFCHYTSSPFVARKNILIKNKFDENLTDDDGIFIDLFLRFNRIGFLSSVIVDSMFLVEYQNTIKINYTSLAIKWTLKEIQYDDEIVFDSKSICDMGSINNFGYCEDFTKLKYIQSLFDFCKNNQIFCYLSDDNTIFNSNNLTVYYNSHLNAKNKTLVDQKLINYELETNKLQIKFDHFDDLFGKIFYKKYFLNQIWINVMQFS